jgi:hypothetical protein
MPQQKARVLLLSVALCGLSQASLAGTLDAFDVSSPPLAISKQVTYAKPLENLKTFVGFEVGTGAYFLKNKGNNTINSLKVEFTATVTDGAETLRLFDPTTYLGGLPGCSYPTAASLGSLTITCQIKQFRAGAEFPAFRIVYEAPSKVTNGTADAVDTDKVKLDVRITYAEGTNGGNPAPNSVALLPMDDAEAAVLGTDNPIFVRSVVPKTGGATLFTGSAVAGFAPGAPATAADPWTTTVVVPGAFTADTGTYTTAELLDTTTDVITTPPSGDCASLASNLSTCSSSSLTVPGTFAKLTIYLRRDFTTLLKPSQDEIASAQIFYSADPGHESTRLPPGSYPLTVPACSDRTVLSLALNASESLPLPGIPCIELRTRYKKSAPAAWALDWEFKIFAIDNGRYIN